MNHKEEMDVAFENCLTYLRRRGRLPFRAASFGPVDNLILSLCAYDPFEWVLPGVESGVWLPFSQAVEKLTQQPGWDDTGLLMSPHTPELVVEAARSPRFRALALGCMETVADQDTQFAALTYRLPDGTLFLAFRGTDDTLAGWKECFAMSYSPSVPSQRLALDYLVRVATKYPGKLRLGGHSKGGNLAVWAAVHAPALLRRRILMVYSNDGPGFHEDLWDLPQHRRVAERLHSIVPKSSVVGMLLEHEEDYTVVDSDQLGFLQHDGFSWQVLGDRFVTLRQVTRQAQLSDQELRRWVRELSAQERGRFVEGLFQVLDASGAETLSDLKADILKATGAMAKALAELDKETRDGLLRFFGILFKSNLRLVLEGIQEEAAEKGAQRRRRRREP